jgi:hypothetical protein
VSAVTGRRFGLVVCLDGEADADGRSLGRVVACSTFHHFADMNWDVAHPAPSFVTDAPSDEMRRDPERLEVFKDYVRNIAIWLPATSPIRAGRPPLASRVSRRAV